MENYTPDFISVINSILLLIDYQEKKLEEVRSADQSEIVNAAVSTARAAGFLNVPVIITSNGPEFGHYINEITDIFPGKEVIRRSSPGNDALHDERVSRLLRRYGRSKIVMAGLWTSDSLIETAVHSIKSGFDVFVLIDGCGDISHERHNHGVHRLLKAGVTPITWMSLASEWMNGWVDPGETEFSEENFGKYNMMLSYLAKH
ncbi:MAG TPA: isochorismatase family protein [Bacteroidales bacterium]|nr:isochorismatase family protein [Bacteroidales bacterium]